MYFETAGALSEPNQTSKMELYVKIVNPFQSLTIFATSYILDVSLVSECAYEMHHENVSFYGRH